MSTYEIRGRVFCQSFPREERASHRLQHYMSVKYRWSIQFRQTIHTKTQ
jgi:hypothetical protein